MLISDAYAQAAGVAPNVAGATSATGGLMGILPLVIVFAVMWLLIIRPQSKKAKEHQKLISELAKGDEVVTQGGVAGRITKVGENYLHLEVAEGKDGPLVLMVQKSAVTTLLPKGSLKNL